MYTAGGLGGGQRIRLKRAKFFQIPPHHVEFFDNPPLDQKKKLKLPPHHHPLLTRKVKYRQYDEILERFMFQIEN